MLVQDYLCKVTIGHKPVDLNAHVQFLPLTGGTVEQNGGSLTAVNQNIPEGIL